MTYNNEHERRLAERRVLSAAVTLAKLAGWKIDPLPPLLSKEFQQYLYVPEAELLLVPSILHFGRVRAQVTSATREARTDAILLMLGRNMRGLIQPYLSVAIWSAQQTTWYGPHMPWIYVDGELWLLPDPSDDLEDQQPSVRVGSRMLRTTTARPWSSAAELYLGFARADAAFAALQAETL